jgi:hypothetical protein
MIVDYIIFYYLYLSKGHKYQHWRDSLGCEIRCIIKKMTGLIFPKFVAFISIF